jgi:hypothetical protein
MVEVLRRGRGQRQDKPAATWWLRIARLCEPGRAKRLGLEVEPRGGFGRHIGAKVNLENGGRDDEVEDVGCGSWQHSVVGGSGVWAGDLR